MNDKEAQTLVENILTKQDIENACMQNFNFFAMLALPEVQYDRKLHGHAERLL